MDKWQEREGVSKMPNEKSAETDRSRARGSRSKEAGKRSRVRESSQQGNGIGQANRSMPHVSKRERRK